MGTETMSAGSAGTVGNIGTGLQVAGMLGQTFGSYKKSSGEKTGYQLQAQIAKQNEAIAKSQAGDAIVRGQTTENNVRQKTAHLKSAQIADLAARGIDLSSGSALDILTSTDVMGERDALTARDNANREAWGHEVAAVNASNNAEMLDWRAEQQSPGMDATATLLGGAGKVASSWYAMRNAKTGTGTGTTLDL